MSPSAVPEALDKKAVTIEEMVPGLRLFCEYEDETPRGERIVVELCRCENPGGSNSLPALWYKHGYTETVLENWWSVRTFVCDSEGNCCGLYNPQSKTEVDEYLNRRAVIDYDWMLPATESNREKLLREIERRAFG